MENLKKVKETILELIYPSKCPFCGEIVSAGKKHSTEHNGICKACREKLPYIGEVRCMCCGKPLTDPAEEYCYDCTRQKHLFVDGRSLWVHKDAVENAVYAMKYQNRRIYGQTFGKEMAEHFLPYLWERKITLIVPVPLHSRRKRKRGFNQAEIVAKVLSKNTGIAMDAGAVKRIKATSPQKELGDKGRKRNIRGAFAVQKNVKGEIMKKKIIEFKDFSFQYRVQAEPTVKNINLSIYEGEKVLIVGPSGSGKSTLAHCINGLVPFFYDGIVTGQLNINGNDATKMNIFELSKIVGTVLQDPDSQFIGLTVGEDIAFKLENYCISQDEMIDRVDKSAELVDIKKELYSSPYKLSGGQKQRVTLAGVTVDDVKILLFDEPLASLDPATGESAIELIDKMQKQNNKTAIIIEHRLEDVLHCDVDRVIVMDKGEIMIQL